MNGWTLVSSIHPVIHLLKQIPEQDFLKSRVTGVCWSPSLGGLVRFHCEKPVFRMHMLCIICSYVIYLFWSCIVGLFADKLYMGPGQLYQDLQNLIHDLSLVNQISSMISSLKGNYQVPAEPTWRPTLLLFTLVLCSIHVCLCLFVNWINRK